MVGIILVKVLSRDIMRYNALAASSPFPLDHLDRADAHHHLGGGDDATEDESGWKLLHGEVFRAPRYRMWLCITVGTGAQMAAMCAVTLGASPPLCLRVLGRGGAAGRGLTEIEALARSLCAPRLPESEQPRRAVDDHGRVLDAVRGAPLPRSLSSLTSSLAHLADAHSPSLPFSPLPLFTRPRSPLPAPRFRRILLRLLLPLLHAHPQSIAGYVASRLYLSFNGDAIRKNILYTALVFPAALYAFLLFLDAFLIGLGSAGAVPLGTLFAIGAMWFGINVPLTVLGGWLGVRKGVSRGASPPLPLLLSLGSTPRSTRLSTH